ncbi:hypothetical protein B0J14DRAFT_67798 [Halenospora varia]|nr:hypothetical protein B0J14DRAFT_67798 [Halenospora varia]
MAQMASLVWRLCMLFSTPTFSSKGGLILGINTRTSESKKIHYGGRFVDIFIGSCHLRAICLPFPKTLRGRKARLQRALKTRTGHEMKWQF